MAKKDTRSTNVNDLDPVLNMSRVEAKEQILVQVAKGQEILKLISQALTVELFKKSRDKYYSWEEFNSEMLGRMFSGEKYRGEYSSNIAVAFLSAGPRSLQESVEELNRDVLRSIRYLNSLCERLEIIPEATGISNMQKNVEAKKIIDEKRIFVVHGRNDLSKNEVARFLERAELAPIILHEQANLGSSTIIDKLERNTDVGFALVLLNGDDEARLRGSDGQLAPRARQNVIFELGYLISKLGRQNVVALYEEGTELPSDVGGVLYVPLDSHGAWKNSIARELDAAKIPFNHRALY